MTYRDEQEQIYTELELLHEKKEEYQAILEALKDRVYSWIIKTDVYNRYEFEIDDDSVMALARYYECELEEIDKQLERFYINKIKED